MGADLLAKLLPAVGKMKWPSNDEITEMGIRAYDICLDEVDGYRGDPRDLQRALKSIQSGNCRPLALAGIAYVVLAASEEKDGSYAPEGLQETMKWLERAQEIRPDLVEINFIEALVYVYSDRMDDARLILNYLHDQQDIPTYRLMQAETIYCYHAGEIDDLEYWTEQAQLAADNVPQKLRLIGRVADAHLNAGNVEAALEHYKKAIHFDRDNPVLWHKVSLIHWKEENYEEAARYNKQVLKLDPKSGPARKLAQALKEKLDEDSGGGPLSRLFGRSG